MDATASALTPHAVRTMHGMDSSMDDEFFVPVVQVLRLKKLRREDGEDDMWSVVLSDGKHFLYGECAPELNPLIYDHDIAQNAILRVKQFAMTTRGARRLCIVFEAERAAPNPGTFFGSPTDIQLHVQNIEFNRRGSAEVSKVDEEPTDPGRNMLQNMIEPNTQSSSVDAFFSARAKPVWHNPQRDFPHRQSVIDNLERILMEAEQAQNPSFSTSRREELSTLAKQWELQLYRQALSFEEFMDPSTFNQRVHELGRRANCHGEVVAQQHCRMHLMRHAMSCHEDPCPVTPFCKDMKDVCRHMETCHEHDCQVPFCATFRKLTMHSARCKAKDCRVCDPTVRVPDCPLCEAEEHSLTSSSQAVQAKLQQERLLTLFHASLCPHEEDSKCLASPLCFDLKRLWIHKIYCAKTDCTFPICRSTSTIVDHYNSCSSGTCHVCPAVRATKAKHGIGRVAPEPTREAVANPSAQSQPGYPSVRATKAQHGIDRVIPEPTREAAPVPSPQSQPSSYSSSSPDVVASQVAIYEEIQRKYKRRTSDASEQQRPESVEATTDEATTDDVVMSDTSSASAKSAIEMAQIREYERLSRAHRQRQQSNCSSASPEKADEDAKLPAHPSDDDDRKPAAQKDYKGAPTENSYLATGHRTRNNTKEVACPGCNADLFVPSVASHFSCQECSKVSSVEGEAAVGQGMQGGTSPTAAVGSLHMKFG